MSRIVSKCCNEAIVVRYESYEALTSANAVKNWYECIGCGKPCITIIEHEAETVIDESTFKCSGGDNWNLMR